MRTGAGTGPGNSSFALELGTGLHPGEGPAPARHLREQLAASTGRYQKGAHGRVGRRAADDLQVGFGEQAWLAMRCEGLSDFVAQVATFAVRAIPGADGAGVPLVGVERRESLVQVPAVRHRFGADIDEIQYAALDEDPVLVRSRR